LRSSGVLTSLASSLAIACRFFLFIVMLIIFTCH
jgi:hypothetical protein